MFFQFTKIVTKNRVNNFAFFVLNINIMLLKRDCDRFKKTSNNNLHRLNLDDVKLIY